MPQLLDISVVISYFNEEESILDTLQMMDDQTYRPLRVFMVNSSSMDDSSNRVNSWIAQDPQRKLVYKNVIKHSRYPSASMNVGIGLCETPWIAFMDCGLEFANDWLEEQVLFLTEHPDVEWVRGVGRFKGVDVVDYCATTQTYGDSRRPHNIPSSLILRSVFDRVGLFASTRAAFDLDWAGRTEKHKIKKAVNNKVEVNYIGANFAKTWRAVARKGYLYARASVAVPGYRRPFRIFAACAMAILLTALLPSMRILFAGAYFVLRGIIIPTRKCRGLVWAKKNPLLVVPMFMVGAILDVSRFLGLFAGICRLTYGGLHRIAGKIISRKRP